jgi:hypothetical protein
MTPRVDAVARTNGRPRRAVPTLTWQRGLVIVALFVAALIVAQSCQKAQIRIGKERAIATARSQVDFTPRQTQIRLVRQGLTSKPYWAVSLSVPNRDGSGYAQLTTVRIDANTGKVAAVTREAGVRSGRGPVEPPATSGG